jgi:Putative Ig domain
MGYKPAHARPRSRGRISRGVGGAVTLVVAISMTVLAFVAPKADAAPAPLPPYPGTITLNLGSPNCITDDVIMNDPSTSLTVTAGSDGSPVVFSQDTLPIWYSMSYWNGSSPESSNSNWTTNAPPGVQINSSTGVISSAPTAMGGTDYTYTVRVTGTDAVGQSGVEQFQIVVINSGATDNLSTTTVSYNGNDSDNANADLTIGLNSNGTQLILSGGNFGNPDTTPVTFTLSPAQPGWHISGVAPAGAVLTGAGVNDPQIEATTNNGDKVLFKLSGISTDSGGNFYTNNDVNPCVTGAVDVVSVTNPGNQNTVVNSAQTLVMSGASSLGTITGWSATGLPHGLGINGSTGVISGTPDTLGTSTVTVTATDSLGKTGSTTFSWTIGSTVVIPPPVSSYGDFVNGFGNGFDVFRQHAASNNPIAGWPATQHDPATHFLRETEGSNFRLEYAPNGFGTGLCVSNPGDNLLVLRGCNANIWQQFYQSGQYVHSAVNGGYVNPNGTGAQLSVGSSPSPWGGSKYHWVSFPSLPA